MECAIPVRAPCTSCLSMAVMSKINKEWHAENKMPKRPTLDERIAWHSQHRKHCACREIPEKLLREMKKRNPTRFAKNAK